jgi:hypothetical protein
MIVLRVILMHICRIYIPSWETENDILPIFHLVVSLYTLLLTDSNDCSDTRVCRDFRCEDPCIGACGVDAECVARRHIPVCQCPAGFTGDPFSRCRRITPGMLFVHFFLISFFFILSAFLFFEQKL